MRNRFRLHAWEVQTICGLPLWVIYVQNKPRLNYNSASSMAFLVVGRVGGIYGKGLEVRGRTGEGSLLGDRDRSLNNCRDRASSSLLLSSFRCLAALSFSAIRRSWVARTSRRGTPLEYSARSASECAYEQPTPRVHLPSAKALHMRVL